MQIPISVFLMLLVFNLTHASAWAHSEAASGNLQAGALNGTVDQAVTHAKLEVDTKTAAYVEALEEKTASEEELKKMKADLELSKLKYLSALQQQTEARGYQAAVQGESENAASPKKSSSSASKGLAAQSMAASMGQQSSASAKQAEAESADSSKDTKSETATNTQAPAAHSASETQNQVVQTNDEAAAAIAESNAALRGLTSPKDSSKPQESSLSKGYASLIAQVDAESAKIKATASATVDADAEAALKEEQTNDTEDSEKVAMSMNEAIEKESKNSAAKKIGKPGELSNGSRRDTASDSTLTSKRLLNSLQ